MFARPKGRITHRKTEQYQTISHNFKTNTYTTLFDIETDLITYSSVAMTKNYPFSLIVILAIFCCSKLQAQSNISGIINDYAAVLNLDQCNGLIRVANASDFSPGMSVLLIQMQGASINESNTAAFGNVTDLGSAGLYERNEISSIAGNEITLRYSLLNTYDLEGSLQIVTIPEYEEAIVDGTLTAQAWNGTTGGVVVFDAGAEAMINSDIDVQGLGFRGGQSNTTNTDSCSSVVFGGFAREFFYPLGDWRGAQKGEGIAKYIAGKEAGQGAQLNGGGGANDHRTGGGGGAHNTPGGQGGTLESLDACRGDVFGKGGNILPLDTARLFMGGGGGGGHANEGGGSDGGNGGGIVIVFADLISGGGTIRVSGEDAATAQEGAGGGGAAGTIVIIAEEIRGRVLLEANGGDGGDTDSQGDLSCAGPGGGGSAGRIYLSDDNTTNPGMAGGQPGQVTNSTGTCNGSNMGATESFRGSVRILSQFPQNLVEAPHIDSIMIGTCANVTGSSIQFGFDYPAASYFEYSFALNDGPFSPQDSVSIDSLLFDNRDSGDSITLLIRAVGANGCPSAFDTIFCSTTTCTGFTLAVATNIDSLYCLADDPFELEAESEEGVFELDGNPVTTFDPSQVGEGRYDLTYSYIDSLGCPRVDRYSTRVVGVPDVPDVTCFSTSDSSITFDWNRTSELYRIIPFVNGTPIVPNVVTETNLTFEDLAPGDSVRIELVALGVGPCGESQAIEQTCVAQECPELIVEIDPLQRDTLCVNDAGIQLNAIPAGGFFRGEGLDSAGFFNPASIEVLPDSSSTLVALIYEVTSTETNCPAVLDTAFVRVLPLPDTAVVRCDSIAADLIRFAWSHPSISVFDVAFSVNGGAFTTQTGITDTFFVVDNLSADDEVEILVTPIGNSPCGSPNPTAATCSTTGCGDTQATIMGLAAAYCIEDESIQLTATPAGGVFSGNGVTATGLFDPASDSTNLGSNVIRYEFIDADGCAFRDTLVTEVLNETPPPVLSCEVGTNQITFSWTHASADTFSLNYFINADPPIGPIGTTDTSFTLTGLMAGDIVFFSVQAIVIGGCGESAMVQCDREIEECIDNPPTINNLTASYCSDEPSFILEGTPAGGTFLINDTEVITEFVPADLGSGQYIIEYVFIDAGGCEQRTSQEVEIIDALTPPEITCSDSTAQSLEFAWNNPNNSLFQYNVIVAGDTIRTDTTTFGMVSIGGLSPADSALIQLVPLDANSCTQASATQVCYTVECNEIVEATLDLEDTYCINNTDDIPLNATPSGGIFSGDGVDPEGFFNPARAGSGELTIFYDFTDDLGCPFRDSFTTEIVLSVTPPNVDCGRADASSASFTWTHPNDSTTFSFAVSLDGVNYSPEIISTDTSYTQTNVDANSDVFFRIFTLGPAGCSNSDTIIINCATNNCAVLDFDILPVEDVCIGVTTDTIALATNLPNSLNISNVIWSGDGIVDAQAGLFDPNANGLNTGPNLIRFEATDAEGCIYEATTSINLNEQPSVSIMNAPEINCGDSLIVLSTTIANTNEATSIRWTTMDGNILSGETETTVAINQAGTYVIEVSNGSCTSIDSVQVAESRDIPIADAGVDQSLDCASNEVTLGGNNSSTGTEIIYNWAGPNNFRSNEQFPVVSNAGTYTLIVEDTLNLCASVPVSVTVMENMDSIGALVNVNGLITCLNTSVTLDASASFAQTNLLYEWSNASGILQNFSDQNTLEVDAAGTYQLRVQDESGCEASTTIVVGDDRDFPIVDAGPDQNIGCLTEEVQLGGANNPTGSNFDLSWSGGNLDGVSDLNPIVQTDGIYVLTILNTQNGCAASDTAFVTAIDDIITNIMSTLETPFCFGDNNGSIRIEEVVGGQAPYSFALNGGRFSGQNRFGNLAPDNYTLSVRDAAGCTFETSVIVEAPFELQATLSADTEIRLGDSTVIDLIVNPSPDSLVRISWNIDDKESCEGCLEFGLRPTDKTTILVEIEDMNGCVDTDVITLFVVSEDKIFAPNVFSPNGDNRNDFFFLSAGTDVERIEDLKIYDRWGTMVFEQAEATPNDPTTGWDGSFEGTPLNPAVFVYRAVVIYKNGRSEEIVGDVALIR